MLPSDFIDHLEIYITGNKEFVILTSPYSWDIDIPKHFKQIDNMYSLNSKSFVFVSTRSNLKFIVNGYL